MEIDEQIDGQTECLMVQKWFYNIQSCSNPFFNQRVVSMWIKKFFLWKWPHLPCQAKSMITAFCIITALQIITSWSHAVNKCVLTITLKTLTSDSEQSVSVFYWSLLSSRFFVINWTELRWQYTQTAPVRIFLDWLKLKSRHDMLKSCKRRLKSAKG